MPTPSGYIEDLIGLYVGEREPDGRYAVMPCCSPRLVLEICRCGPLAKVNTWDRLRALMFGKMPTDQLPEGAYDTALSAYETWDAWKRPRAKELART